MNKNEIFNQLKEIFQTIFPSSTKLNDIKFTDNLILDLGLNSIAIVYMAFAIEQRFKIDVSKVSVKSFSTVGDVVDYIAQKLIK